jgi:nucleoside phosphorylase
VTRLLLVPSALERERLAVPPGVELLPCGVGVVAAALATAERLARGPVRAALLVGLCGTRDPARAPLGSLVLGTAARNEAVGAGQGRHFVPTGRMPLQPGDAPPDLLPLRDLALPGVLRGVIGTVAAASGSPAEAAAWHALHPDVLVEEMEAHAVAAACARAGVPLSVLRAVCNACGDRALARWDVAGACAALQAALPAACDALADTVRA